MSKLLTLTGFERYYPDEGDPEVPYFRDSEGRDWYDARHLFRSDTMKFMFDAEGRLLSFSDSAVFMYPMNSISEVLTSKWPPCVTLSGFWRCKPGHIECAIENIEQRMVNMADTWLARHGENAAIVLAIDEWKADANWPYVAFPRFAPHLANELIELGMDKREYDILTMKEYVGW